MRQRQVSVTHNIKTSHSALHHMSIPFPWMPEELASLAEHGLWRVRRTVLRRPNGWCEVDGRRLRDFASNDYLGLSQDPRVIEAAQRAAAECGAGSGGSQLVVGRSPWHERLESRLAQFEGQEAALLFPTGYAANVGSIAALVGHGDLICSDRLNHASLIDGCRLSGAELYVYDHDQLDGLETRLRAVKNVRRKLIVTDGVFSMDGVLAPLAELCALAGRYGAELLVDEAHATGVFGRRGRGVAELLEVEGGVAVRVGTLSKALGSVGGFVTGSRTLVDWLWNRARTQIFSTAAPPAACAAACAALEIIEAEPTRREKLLSLALRLRQGIGALGLETVSGGTGPIVPVLLRDPRSAMFVARRLEERGFLVGAMRPPSVPAGTSRLRIGVTAINDVEEIVALLDALEKAAITELAV
ncbi:MAG TPA: 8-amino-7-oxononanoate synthase [Planctomycetaceae bacterium]|jgi:8-amino-7-oxononanoate synthase|nr:8-amino-7-oxononanoate synthase [Planctomycetaceae bacterium]